MSDNISHVLLDIKCTDSQDIAASIYVFMIDGIPWVPVTKTASNLHTVPKFVNDDMIKWEKSGNSLNTPPPGILAYIKTNISLSEMRQNYKVGSYATMRSNEKWLPLDEFIKFCVRFMNTNSWKQTFESNRFGFLKKYATTCTHSSNINTPVVEEEIIEKEVSDHLHDVYFRTKEWRDQIEEERAKLFEKEQALLKERFTVLSKKKTEEFKQYCKRKRAEVDDYVLSQRIEAVATMMSDPDVIAEANEMNTRNKIISKDPIRLDLKRARTDGNSIKEEEEDRFSATINDILAEFTTVK